MEPLFLDTWAFVAHFNAAETAKVKWLFESTEPRPLVTSWQVITETIGFACGSRFSAKARDSAMVAGHLKTWMEREFFVVEHCTEDQMRQALELRVRHRDVALVDCTTAVLCEAHQLRWVVSKDAHLPLGHCARRVRASNSTVRGW